MPRNASDKFTAIHNLRAITSPTRCSPPCPRRLETRWECLDECSYTLTRSNTFPVGFRHPSPIALPVLSSESERKQSSFPRSLLLNVHCERLIDVANASDHLLLALLPATGMAVIALYMAICICKYGNNASIVVQSSVCNGWMFPFLGTLALLAGQVPSEVRRTFS